jgi:transcriptional regulator with PAS, ATPase and Fis domain
MSPEQRRTHNPIPGQGLAGGHSRTLIYFPIVHTQADMGALQESVARATLEKTGRAGLARKFAAIDKIWTAIEALPLSFDRVRLYQDGLPVCGREAEIVTELAQAGSRNHQLLLRLITRGAVLMGTGSGDLLVQEYQLARQSLTTRPPRAAAVAASRRALSQTLRQRQSQSEKIAADNCLRVMMGHSDAVTRIIREVNRVAQSDFSVIIQGETGSGKELVARAVHQLSRRESGAFIPLDCGAIPETLIESELFAYQKGAFTGATGPKAGKFEAAQGCTLFLDEIANLPLASQTRLLRVLQEKAVLRLGAAQTIKIDVRLVTASNQELQGMVNSGQMREDLFFRLNEFTIAIPPLRERKDDIP